MSISADGICSCWHGLSKCRASWPDGEVTALTLKASAALTGVHRIRRGQDVIVQVAATAGMREEALQCIEADPGGPGSARPALHVDLRRIPK